jgi:uncharacterized Zn-binding protein involved in type VI secretion
MPAVHRDQDSRSCGAKTNVTNQSSVYVDGLLAAVVGDKDSHGGNKGTFIGGLSNNVYVENKLIIVVGDGAQTDTVGATTHNNTNAFTGSSDVYCSGS